MSLTDLN